MDGAQEFKTGDIVEIKSGGPKMTIADDKPTHDRQIKCQWFAGHKLEVGWFPIQSLVRAEEAEKKG